MFDFVTKQLQKPINNQDESIPSVVKSILHDFQVLVTDELFKELLLMQDIEHSIDLVPRASLPNLLAYQMSPTEHAELKHQIDQQPGLHSRQPKPMWPAAKTIPSGDTSLHIGANRK